MGEYREYSLVDFNKNIEGCGVITGISIGYHENEDGFMVNAIHIILYNNVECVIYDNNISDLDNREMECIGLLDDFIGNGIRRMRLVKSIKDDYWMIVCIMDNGKESGIIIISINDILSSKPDVRYLIKRPS